MNTTPKQPAHGCTRWPCRTRSLCVHTGRLERRTRLERHSRLNPLNSARRLRRRAKAFGDHADKVRSLPCCVCGARPPSHPHHWKTRAAGGTAKHLVSLCTAHHSEVHQIGRDTFEAKHGISLEQEAARLWGTI